LGETRQRIRKKMGRPQKKPSTARRPKRGRGRKKIPPRHWFGKRKPEEESHINGNLVCRIRQVSVAKDMSPLAKYRRHKPLSTHSTKPRHRIRSRGTWKKRNNQGNLPLQGSWRSPRSKTVSFPAKQAQKKNFPRGTGSLLQGWAGGPRGKKQTRLQNERHMRGLSPYRYKNSTEVGV